MIPFGAGINSSLPIAESLGATPEEAIWLVASYPLTQGTFVLMGCRIGAVHGHKNAVIVAGIWWIVFHLISAFMRSIVSLSLTRALRSIGAAFILPNAIALLTTTFPPRKAPNISVGLFGAMAPIGAAGGSIFSGIFGQLAPWWWLFIFLAILGTAIFALFFFAVPAESQVLDPSGKIDYIGAYFGVAGLFLFNFGRLTIRSQAAIIGWTVPYIYALLIVSILHFIAFAVWESKFASRPIMPMSIWTSPSFSMMVLSAFVSFMAFGLCLWYLNVWQIHIRRYSVFLNAGTYVPLAIGGAGAAILSAKLVRYLDAQYILAIGSTVTLIALLLVATMPEQQTYWAQVFPSILVGSMGPDFLFTAAQLIASGTVKRSRQGVAGSLIGTVLAYGMATGLGFAGTVEYYTNDGGRDLVEGYRNGLYLGIGMAVLAMVLSLVFVRIPKDRREGWDQDNQSVE
ncbi:major facilitator superfamily domain-containing protein [Ilyonectria destructans]|nr:major facilitator superfamily domain-containing protein [Ilyonectria destructans]